MIENIFKISFKPKIGRISAKYDCYKLTLSKLPDFINKF